MKRDPFINPIPLTGEWKFVEPRKRDPFKGSFWYISSRLSQYRKANHIANSDIEQCQLEILVSERKRRGLDSSVESRSTFVSMETPTQKYVRKLTRSGGCRSCGQKRALHR